jgi:tRNA 2-selenouridine synthase
MFENILAFALKASGPIAPENESAVTWLEDESQRIGNCNIPMALWQRMRNAPVIFLDIPFEERLKHITNEYGVCDTGQLTESVLRIKKRLGGLDTKNSVQYLEAGNLKEAFRILLQYYDKQYLKGLHNRDNLAELVTIIACPEVTIENARILLSKKLIL